jgi:hypothetical protein
VSHEAGYQTALSGHCTAPQYGKVNMDPNAPRVAALLRSLTPQLQRIILAKACAFSAATLGEVSAEVSELLDAVKKHGGLSPEQAAKALAFAEQADRRSFQLEEQSAPRQQWLKLFSEARLAAAMVMAFGPEPETDSSAYYELLKSQDHGAGIERLIESEIAALR